MNYAVLKSSMRTLLNQNENSISFDGETILKLYYDVIFLVQHDVAQKTEELQMQRNTLGWKQSGWWFLKKNYVC